MIYSLMFKDIEVLSFNADTGRVELLNINLLPFGIQKHNDMIVRELRYWIISRCMSRSRDNADYLISTLKTNPYKLMIDNFSLSINDPYWIKRRESELSYSDVSIFINQWDEDLANFMITGDEFPEKLYNSVTPELTLRGSWPKRLIKESESIYLLKATCDFEYEEDIENEISVSRLLDKLKIPHAEYSRTEYKELPCSKTKILTTDNLHWVSAKEFMKSTNCINYVELGLRFGKDSFKEMVIIDYLTGNVDRHSENWSFEYNDDNKILGMSPIYDFNLSFTANEDNFEYMHAEIYDILDILFTENDLNSFLIEVKSALDEIEISEWRKKYIQKRLDNLKYKYRMRLELV